MTDELDLYGTYKAKINPEALARLADKPDGLEIVVTAITPTPLGEGKTTTTIGLAQGLNRIGVRAAPTIRQPSLGPVFGLKGGAAGGGFSQVLPMEEINIHFTGDLHAVAAAHNLGAAFLDNHLFRGNSLGIDPTTVRWPRVIDVNDRALRRSMIGLGDPKVVRETEWHITAASEVMAILALAEDMADLRARIGRSIVAENFEGTPVTLDDLKVAGAMTVLMREAMKPNLVQTIEGGPAFIHAGPFANIAHGNSSVVADRIALKLVDAVVTEAGFGSDMGFQKFVDIKCRLSGLRPAAAVIVATIRALKMHGGVGHVVAGKPLDPVLTGEDPEGVERGCANLLQHIEIVRGYGIPRSWRSTPSHRPAVGDRGRQARPRWRPARTTPWSRTTSRAAARAPRTWRAPSGPRDDPNAGTKTATTSASSRATTRRSRSASRASPRGSTARTASTSAARQQKQLHEFERLGYGHLPVCMAKTALSLSHDPELKGRPTGFRVPIRDARLFAGAGFVTAYCGDMLMMPGLPSRPVWRGRRHRRRRRDGRALLGARSGAIQTSHDASRRSDHEARPGVRPGSRPRPPSRQCPTRPNRSGRARPRRGRGRRPMIARVLRLMWVPGRGARLTSASARSDALVSVMAATPRVIRSSTVSSAGMFESGSPRMKSSDSFHAVRSTRRGRVIVSGLPHLDRGVRMASCPSRSWPARARRRSRPPGRRSGLAGSRCIARGVAARKARTPRVSLPACSIPTIRPGPGSGVISSIVSTFVSKPCRPSCTGSLLRKPSLHPPGPAAAPSPGRSRGSRGSRCRRRSGRPTRAAPGA